MNIKATIVPFQQGTEEWAQHRARSLNASDLAAAMGMSKYMTRAELIARIATGIVPEVDAATQRRFDKGHEVEAAARPLAEEIIGESLYPVVLAADIEGLHVSASLDGQDLLGDVTWEHKLSGADLIASLDAGVIPEQYHPQMEQGLMLSGAKRCLFMASNGTRESMRFCWYESNPELRAKIIPTWKQLMADVAAYVPTAKAAPVIAAPVETLPAVSVKVDGALAIVSNLPDFGAALRTFIEKIPANPSTDQEFADTEAACKSLKKAEEALDAAETNALAQLTDVDTMRRFVADYKALARTTRLQKEKLVAARKEAIKGEIVAEGVGAFAAHIRTLNAAMPGNYMPQVPADFGGCIKGLKSVDSIRNAVSTELANAKIRANEIATRIQTNIGQIDVANAPMLFHDMATLVLKQPDDLAAVIAQRLAAEQQRKEAERERIRAEEAARLEREAEAARKDREALELLARKREQDEADRIARDLDEASNVHTEMGLTLAKAPPCHQTVMVPLKVNTEADDGARMTLGEINARIAPVSITVAGLSLLGYEPVAIEKAARLYPASKFAAICAAISAHVLAAPVKALEAA